MNTLILSLFLFQGNIDVKAKVAFETVQFHSEIAKIAFDAVKIDCSCQNCDCTGCKCQGICNCDACHSFEAVYAKSIKDNKVIVLAVGVPKLDLPWTFLEVKAITGEKPGYIVGVPKDGKLVRLDFAIGTPKQRMRLDVLHVIYPLTSGYVECPTCPQGRIRQINYPR